MDHTPFDGTEEFPIVNLSRPLYKQLLFVCSSSSSFCKLREPYRNVNQISTNGKCTFDSYTVCDLNAEPNDSLITMSNSMYIVPSKERRKNCSTHSQNIAQSAESNCQSSILFFLDEQYASCSVSSCATAEFSLSLSALFPFVNQINLCTYSIVGAAICYYIVYRNSLLHNRQQLLS